MGSSRPLDQPGWFYTGQASAVVTGVSDEDRRSCETEKNPNLCLLVAYGTCISLGICSSLPWGTQLCPMRILIYCWGLHLSRATSGELNWFLGRAGEVGGSPWLPLRS